MKTIYVTFAVPHLFQEDEEYEETEWNEGFNCCWGFYGELNKAEDIMFENAGLNPDEFEEEIA